MRPRVTLQLPLTSGPAVTLSGAHVLLIGYGYIAQAMAPVLQRAGATVQHTSRANGDLPFGSAAMRDTFERADVVLTSVPPSRDGSDAALSALRGSKSHAKWIGYLSATSIYGDRSGQWAFEGEAPTPGLERGYRRANAELAWLETCPQTHIFRLAGIYGPSREPFTKIIDGSARVIDAPGHVVNRIHIDDIVSALIASIARPSPQDIYNVADGHPAPPGDVLRFAADLIGRDVPPTLRLNDPSVSPMARSFYAESKKVDISHIKTRLGWEPRFKTYQDGLRAVLKSMDET